MGIRNIVRGLREKHGPGGRKPLALTEAAVAAIRARIDAEPGGRIAFTVVTKPSPIGFQVGVGFKVPEPGDPEPQGDYPVPVLVGAEDRERLEGTTIDYRDDRFVTTSDVSVHVSDTPNPDSRKFVVNRDLVTEGSATFEQPPREGDPHLARMLLEVPGVKRVFLIRSFCSVTREPGSPWDAVQAEVGRRLQAYFAHGGAAVEPPPPDPARQGEVAERIVQLLEDVVRPAVQRDGGDIVFAGYDEGVVQLYMLGSCVGCPSSMATLKMGVENLLKEQIPEIREVVAVD